jgi:cell division protease FtsH
MSPEEKKLIAYHEAGHALIGLAMEDAEKVQKITIIPRGQAGGYVLMTPKKEKFVQTKAELLAKVTSYMAGRASEEFFFGKDEITTGAYSDIESATQIARRMVTEFGMSDLGPIQYEKPAGNVFLGRDFNNSSRNYSGQLAHEIDKEIRKIIDTSYSEASVLIKKFKPLMDILAEALLIKETLTAEEAEYI